MHNSGAGAQRRVHLRRQTRLMTATIGRYQIVGELGRGDMGIVYKAVDPTIGRTVALKTLRLDTQGVPVANLMRRFKDEARLAGAMNHPNIVTIYDAGDHADCFYIAMEYLEGRTLQSILQEQGRLPVQKIVEMARHVCSALDYAHQRKVIHRDIKPANVMTTPLGAVKIMDFGIAKSEAGITSAGQVLGTPAYMSPEQVQGKELDGRSDLFSFGVMLYEMVTGEMPFTGKNVTTIIYKIVHEAPIPPRQLDSTIHPKLSEIITKSLAKSPDERYQSGAELVHELDNYKAAKIDRDATWVMGGSMPARVVQASSPDSPTIGMTQMQSPARIEPTPKVARVVAAAAAAAPAKAMTPVAKKAPTMQESHGTRNAMIAMVLLLIGALFAARVMHVKLPGLTSPKVTESGAAMHPPAIPTQPAATVATPAEANPEPTTLAEAEKPKPVAASPPRFGELQINSTPSGAQVSISGKTEDAWVTPFRAKKLAAGNHQLTFTLPNYESQTMNVKVAAGETMAIGAELTASTGTLAIQSNPAGANIFIDNQPTGKQTPNQIALPPGEHSILLQKAGYLPENTAVSLLPGQTYQIG